jgi:OFA family oxalate/formate antiporter-like MFS transporter
VRRAVIAQNRWFQLGAALVTMIMIANLQYAWTLFVEPIHAAWGWRLSEIQFAFTLFVLLQVWTQPLDGWLIDRLGPRGFISAAGLLCGLGWAGMGYAKTLPMLYAFYCAAGIGAAFVYSCAIGLALKWFTDRRGLASGILAAGFGGGTALFVPIIAWIIETNGYQAAFVVTGIAQGVVTVVVAQWLKHPGATAVRAPGRPVAEGGVAHVTTLEMLRAPRFYAIYVMFVLMATGGLLVTANAGPMARSWGLTTGVLTLAATLSPLANGASRIFWGWMSDRLGREPIMICSFALQSVCLYLAVTLGPRSAAAFTITLVLVYFTWGQIFALFPAITGDYFGARHATSNYAVLYTAKGVASIIGGWLGAVLFEQSGGWTLAFHGSAVMAAVAAALAAALRVARSPGRLAVGPTAAR